MREDSFAAALSKLREQLAGLAAQLTDSEARLEKAHDEITRHKRPRLNPELVGERARFWGVAG